MAKSTTPYVDMSDLREKIENFKKEVENPAPVFVRTLKDLNSRAPGKVADAVRTVYNIKKNEITCKKGFSKTAAGTISAQGKELAEFTLHYEGRVLTPLHFGMTPKERPEGKKKYKVKAKIKGQTKKTFTAPEGGGVFLAPASKSATTIAWFRNSASRYDITPIKTISLPQMVDNTEVREVIHNDLGELLDKRFNHHLSRTLDRATKK
ncbi:MAG: hypothetical protein IKW45_03810 [Clostridia bacterium]|nr:hypothetical protein [Clostridia bacterium]